MQLTTCRVPLYYSRSPTPHPCFRIKPMLPLAARGRILPGQSRQYVEKDTSNFQKTTRYQGNSGMKMTLHTRLMHLCMY
jgi:hypothetical protein